MRHATIRRAFAAADLQAQRDRVDQAAAAYRLAAGRVAAGAALRARIAYGLAELRRLPEQRAAVDRLPITAADTRVAPRIEVAEEEGEEHLQAATAAGHGAIDTPGKALDQYSDVVNDLLDINTQIAPGAGDERLL